MTGVCYHCGGELYILDDVTLCHGCDTRQFEGARTYCPSPSEIEEAAKVEKAASLARLRAQEHNRGIIEKRDKRPRRACKKVTKR